LSSSKKTRNPDLCYASAVLYQLSFQANWEQVVMWVDYKAVDVLIDDDNTGNFHGFKMRIGKYDFDHFDHLSTAEKFRPEQGFKP